METQDLELAPFNAPDNDTLKRADTLSIWKDFRAKFETLKATAETLVVKDERDVATIRLATETRKQLKAVRCAVENKRVELVEGLKKDAKKIDNAAKEIRLLIEPLEERMREQEEFAERAAAARKQQLATDRGQMLQPFGLNSAAYNLGEMAEEDWTALFDGLKSAHESKLAAAKKAEEERAAKAKAEAEERERQRLENERLKKEAGEREAQMKAEREKAERERKEAEESARKERDAIEAAAKAERARIEAKHREEEAKAAALAKKEREAQAEKARKEREELQRKFEAEQKKQAEERAAREKVEAELRAKQEAEEMHQARLAEEKIIAAKAPDREKLLALAGQIRALPFPSLATDSGGEVLKEIAAQAEKFAAWIEKKAGAM